MIANQTGTGWQLRQNGRTYFYRTVTLPDGHREKKYFGRGEEAEIESAKLASETKKEKRFADTRRLTRDAKSTMKHLAVTVDTLVSATLILEGYHNPNGRGWRLKAMRTSQQQEQKKRRSKAVTDDHGTSSPQPHKRTLEEIVQAAKGGDQSVIPELRDAMKRAPELFTAARDLASEVQIRWLHRLTPTDLHRRECLRQRIVQMKQEFIDEGDSPSERLLIDEIIAVWLQHQFCEQCNVLFEKPDPRVAAFYANRTESSARRYLKAIEALAKHRALLSKMKKPTATKKSVPKATASKVRK